MLQSQFSHSVTSGSLRPHGLQHARLPCPSPAPRACSNSCPLSQWCNPTISSSVVPFSSRLQSFPASRSFPMIQFFASGGQSTGQDYTFRDHFYSSYCKRWNKNQTQASRGFKTGSCRGLVAESHGWCHTRRKPWVCALFCSKTMKSYVSNLVKYGSSLLPPPLLLKRILL